MKPPKPPENVMTRNPSGKSASQLHCAMALWSMKSEMKEKYGDNWDKGPKAPANISKCL